MKQENQKTSAAEGIGADSAVACPREGDVQAIASATEGIGADSAAGPRGKPEVVSDERREELKGIFTLDASRVESHLDKTVRKTVEKALNDLLDAEADDLCGAKRYERSPDRIDSRAGHYTRVLETKAGPVTLKMPVSVRRTPLLPGVWVWR